MRAVRAGDFSEHQCARRGLFPAEWKLAVDRSHLMADDAPFLFPVMIDDASGAAARVPDKFREVQWTRLNVKDTPETLAARVAKILGGGMGAPEIARAARPTAEGSAKKSSPAWVVTRGRFLACDWESRIGLMCEV